MGAKTIPTAKNSGNTLLGVRIGLQSSALDGYVSDIRERHTAMPLSVAGEKRYLVYH